MNSLLKQSLHIYEQAVADFKPYAVVLMVSGGTDSITAAEVAKALGMKVDFVLHGHTGTGIRETLEFVREVAPLYASQYIEASAGTAYEDYVLRKGFFGQGDTAHNYAYHILKRGVFQAALSKYIRHRKRNRNILLLNGARINESNRRKHNLNKVFNIEPIVKANIWVNIIHHWTGQQCKDFLTDQKAPINPVTQKLCRSGECLCGSMQTRPEGEEIAYYYPEWGKWRDDLERRVFKRGFNWGWAERMPNKYQLPILFDDFQPACVRCVEENQDDNSND